MSDTPTDAVDDLKRRARRRLIGAIALAVVAAIVFPLVLERQPKPLGPDVQVEIPPVNSDRFVTRLSSPPETTPTTPALNGASQPSAEQSKSELTASKEPEPSRVIAAPPEQNKDPSGKAADNASKVDSPETVKAGEKSPKYSEVKALADAARATPPEKGFVVQLAAYAEPISAETLARKLQASGFPAYTQSLSTSHGDLTRVRVGPFASKDAAEAARAKLKADGQNGLVEPSR